MDRRFLVVFGVFFIYLSKLVVTADSEPIKSFRTRVAVGVVYSGTDQNRQTALEIARSAKDKVQKNLISLADMAFLPISSSVHENFSYAIDVRKIILYSNISSLIGHYDEVIASIAEDLRIPYIVSSQNLDISTKSISPRKYVFQMLPSNRILHKAALEVVKSYKLKKVVVIYDRDKGLHLVENHLVENLWEENIEVMAFKLHHNSTFTSLPKQLQYFRQKRMKSFIIICSQGNLDNILDQALRLSMLINAYTWIYVDLNMNSFEYSKYSNTGINFTTFAISGSNVISNSAYHSSGFHPTVIYDSLLMIETAVASLNTTTYQNKCQGAERHKKCAISMPNVQFVEAMHKLSVEGMTGMISFTSNNRRANVSMDIMSLTPSGMHTIGKWSQSSDSSSNSSNKGTQHLILNSKSSSRGPKTTGLHGIVKIVTVEDPPFVIIDKKLAGQGNKQFSGYLIDMIREIAKKLNFHYEIYESTDGIYGNHDENKEWDGVVRQLIDGNASIAVCAMAITLERERYIDFTKPHGDMRISIMMKKPSVKTSMFQFISPFSGYVWLTIVATWVFASSLLFLIDKYSPGSKNNNDFPPNESFWFMFGSMVSQCTRDPPITISGRLLTGVWWFSFMILIASYTANLAAFLTVTQILTPIDSLDDLAGQTKVKYGTVKGSYPSHFFSSSNVEMYKKMWRFMSEINVDSMVHDANAGLKKLKEEDYAFFWDEKFAQYVGLNDCDVMTVGTPFGWKGYGLGVPVGADYTQDLTLTILELEETGVLHHLEERWWGAGKCNLEKETPHSDTTKLGLDNLAGVFVILGVGAGLSILVCLLEIMISRIRSTKTARRKEQIEFKATGSDGLNKNI